MVHWGAEQEDEEGKSEWKKMKNKTAGIKRGDLAESRVGGGGGGTSTTIKLMEHDK